MGVTASPVLSSGAAVVRASAEPESALKPQLTAEMRMSILCVLLARSKHSKMGLLADRACSKLRFGSLPLENQHSGDKRCRKRKVAFFREPATWEDDALMSQRHVTCPGKAGRFQRGGHGEKLGGGIRAGEAGGQVVLHGPAST